jgi:hypothetical protein
MTRISRWKEKLLSMGGKEILIKSIAQAVSIYAMMVFEIPKKIYKGMYIEGSTGRNGGNCVCRREMGEWDSEIYSHST